jgi:hypothetical protein
MEKNEILNTKPSPTIEYMKCLEKKWGIEIPPDLINFFIKTNGGYPKFNTYTMENGEECVLDEFLAVGPQEEFGSFEDMIESLMFEQDVIPKYLIPFAESGVGDFYCISTKEETYGKIYIFYHEFYDDLDEAIKYIAPSLDVFINNMREDE